MTVVIGSTDEPASTDLGSAVDAGDPGSAQGVHQSCSYQDRTTPSSSACDTRTASHCDLPNDEQQKASTSDQGRQLKTEENDLQHVILPSSDAASQEPVPCTFPEEELRKLEEMINRSRWVIPVLPNGELEVLLIAALRLARNGGADEKNDLCVRFIRDGLTTSFAKILTDEAVSGWKYEIHKCIYQNCALLIELCVEKLNSNCQPLFDLLALVFNPDNKFHQYNASRSMDTALHDANAVYAKCVDARSPKGWLANLINRFGMLGGFEALLRRFDDSNDSEKVDLSLGVIVSLVKPFGQCCQFLTRHTLNTYLMPIVERVPQYLHRLSDEQLKKDTKNDSLSLLVKWLRSIASCAGRAATVERLEEFRLQMLLKLLQISSFNGKMNALNEVNKVITAVMLYRHNVSPHSNQRCGGIDAPSKLEYMSTHKIVGWIRDNNVLSVVLRDSLHQPQYVEKLEKILRFMIKEKALSITDLDAIWESQSGATRHEAIVKNIHDLLAKLAWDFSPEQLEYVFESCFKKSWATAQTKKEREKLIELIRRLAEDDKDGVMAHKVLQLLWGLAHNQQVPNEIVEMALLAHLKILDYSCCQDRSAQKQHWLEECVKELKHNDKWVIPALKHIRDICMLYQESQHQQQASHSLPPRGTVQGPARSDIISALQQKHTLVPLVTTNLVNYVQDSKSYVKSHPDPSVPREGHRFSHNVNVQERLLFLRFLLKDGQLWLCAQQATQIWKCLTENGAYPSDSEACFNWFAKLMGDEPDLDPDVNRTFFEENILQFDPSQLTECGIHCFQRFFTIVNVREGNLIPAKSGSNASVGSSSDLVLVNEVELIGQEYLWKIVLLASDEVSARAAEILRKGIAMPLGPRLQNSRRALHEEFVLTCFDRIRMAYDTWKCLQPSEQTPELRKMKRLLRLLTRCVQQQPQQCENDFYLIDRRYPPLYRAARGTEVRITFQVCSNSSNTTTSWNSTPLGNNNNNLCDSPSGSGDEFTVLSHSNETLLSLRRRLEIRFGRKKVDLFCGEEPLADRLQQCICVAFPSKKQINLLAKMIGPALSASSQPLQLSTNALTTQSASSVLNSGCAATENSKGNAHVDGTAAAQGNTSHQPSLAWASPSPSSSETSGSSSSPQTGRLAQEPGGANGECFDRLCETISGYCPSASLTQQGLHDLCKMEHLLPPGALISQCEASVKFILCLCDIEELHEDAWALLQQCPAGSEVEHWLQEQLRAETPTNDISICSGTTQLNAITSPAELQYHLEVLYAMLLPASETIMTDDVLALQCDSVRSGILHALSERLLVVPQAKCSPDVQSMFGLSNIGLNKQAQIPENCFNLTNVARLRLVLLRLFRFLVACLIRDRARQSGSAAVEPHEESVVCAVADRVVAELRKRNREKGVEPLQPSIVKCILANLVESAWKMAKSCKPSSPALDCVNPLEGNIPVVCQESLHTLTAGLRFLADDHIAHQVLQNTDFVLDTLLKCANSEIRLAAEEAFLRIGVQFDTLGFINTLYSRVNADVVQYHGNSCAYFSLIGKLFQAVPTFSGAIDIFTEELKWLRSTAKAPVKQPSSLIEGHLIIAISVCRFLVSSDKLRYTDFVQELLEDFVFPASKTFVALKLPDTALGENGPRIDPSFADHCDALDKGVTQPKWEPAEALCTNEATMNAALDLVVELSTSCLANLRKATQILCYLFYSDKNTRFTEWEYLTAMGPRPTDGFVGLKNAGATCYMNSVLQQLFMIEPIRLGLLSQKDIVTDADLASSATESNYVLGVLKQVIIIFGFLQKSQLQFYVPQGFWNHFRLWGEPVNVREQHDALEFFNCLVDSIDEALKSLNRPTILNKVLGGTFADQKICKGCPHRYSREEGFTTLNIDIRNHSNLLDSLEQYVKGDLLEGPNAYHCEQCNKKVDTVKRLCIKALPQILAIQLKRFDYDWDHECAVKFNDYFEFPRELDMEPYTVEGLARREGELVESEKKSGSADHDTKPEHVFDSKKDVYGTVYDLCGIVVHSGQASGGHYYSYIKTRGRWYKFDDGEVCESKMETHEEMKNQCFGGDYLSEIFDHISKRMSCRRQKRWWNAYILFYERVRHHDELADADCQVKETSSNTENCNENVSLPPAIEMSVWRQTLRYTHVRIQFSAEFFRFMKRLVAANSKPPENIDESACQSQFVCLALPSVQLAERFLFNTYFRAKKYLRGNMFDWISTVIGYFSCSSEARTWFAERLTTALAAPSSNDPPENNTICTYLLESPVEEVRQCFAHLLANLCHYLLKDTPVESPEPNSLASLILSKIMRLLAKNVCEYGRHVNHYFLFYSLYANMGSREKEHLIKSDVPLVFIQLALDDGAIKYQFVELGKFYQTIAVLLHCFDVTPYQHASSSSDSDQGSNSLPANPYARNTLASMPDRVAEYLFQSSSLIKKMLEDANGVFEVVELLKYLCWENQDMSRRVLTELLWFLAYVCTYEVRPFLDIMNQIVSIPDSWQMSRITFALKGFHRPDHEGLFDIIDRSRDHYPKRSYQCIKFIVDLFTRVPEAVEVSSNARHRLEDAVEWVCLQLDRKAHYSAGSVGQQDRQQTAPPWSPLSNETTNGFFLERSASAIDMISRAGKFFRDTEPAIPAPSEITAPQAEQTSSASPDDFDVRSASPGTPEQTPTSQNANQRQQQQQLAQQTQHSPQQQQQQTSQSAQQSPQEDQQEFVKSSSNSKKRSYQRLRHLLNQSFTNSTRPIEKPPESGAENDSFSNTLLRQYWEHCWEDNADGADLNMVSKPSGDDSCGVSATQPQTQP